MDQHIQLREYLHTLDANIFNELEISMGKYYDKYESAENMFYELAMKVKEGREIYILPMGISGVINADLVARFVALESIHRRYDS